MTCLGTNRETTGKTVRDQANASAAPDHPEPNDSNQYDESNEHDHTSLLDGTTNNNKKTAVDMSRNTINSTTELHSIEPHENEHVVTDIISDQMEKTRTLTEKYLTGNIANSDLFEIITDSPKQAFSGGVSEDKIKVEFSEDAYLISASGFLKSIMSDAIDAVLERLQWKDSDDLVQLALDSSNLEYTISSGIYVLLT